MSVLSLRYLFVSMRIVALLLRGAILKSQFLQAIQWVALSRLSKGFPVSKIGAFLFVLTLAR